MAVLKKSVAFDEAVGREALTVAGARGFSRFVNDAVAQRLQAIRIEEAYSDFVRKHGPAPSETRRAVREEWDNPPTSR